LLLKFFDFIKTGRLLDDVVGWLVCLVGILVTRWANFGRPDPMMLFQPVTLLTSRAESGESFLF
jgi:hypothetical protein